MSRGTSPPLSFSFSVSEREAFLSFAFTLGDMSLAGSSQNEGSNTVQRATTTNKVRKCFQRAPRNLTDFLRGLPFQSSAAQTHQGAITQLTQTKTNCRPSAAKSAERQRKTVCTRRHRPTKRSPNQTNAVAFRHTHTRSCNPHPLACLSSSRTCRPHTLQHKTHDPLVLFSSKKKKTNTTTAHYEKESDTLSSKKATNNGEKQKQTKGT